MQFITKVQSHELNEISGLVASKINQGILWVHNDSGDQPYIYAIDRNGKLVATVELSNAKNIDWEDISIEHNIDHSIIYIADTGDNKRKRKSYQIYSFKEPKLDFRKYEKIELTDNQYQRIDFTYSDSNSYDCEAIMFDPISNAIYFLTKRTKRSKLFRLDAHNSNVAKFEINTNLGEFGRNGIQDRICGADISNSGAYIAIRSYDSIFVFDRNHNSISKSINSDYNSIPYNNLIDPQNESICFDPKEEQLITIGEVVEFFGAKRGGDIYYIKKAHGSKP